MPNLRALEAISKLSLDIGPFTQSTTGATVPFFNDSRKVYSHPDIFNVFVEELTALIQKYTDCNLIVGIPMAGIPLATALSIKTNVPFAYLNKERKPTLRKRIVEGDYADGVTALLVDDVIGLGGAMKTAIVHCKEDGIIVQHIATMWNPWFPKNQPFLDELAAQDITYDTLYTRIEWMDYLIEKGIASQEMKTIHDAYVADPVHWHINPTMWQKFETWKAHFEKTGQL